jgi:hypothetical protein
MFGLLFASDHDEKWLVISKKEKKAKNDGLTLHLCLEYF